jgi:hypothetical protein
MDVEAVNAIAGNEALALRPRVVQYVGAIERHVFLVVVCAVCNATNLALSGPEYVLLTRFFIMRVKTKIRF